MKLYGLGTLDYSSYSDLELDNAYADAFSAGASQEQAAAGIEIIARLATPTGAIRAALGIEQFPRYAAIQRGGTTTAAFDPVQVAQTAVETRAANVGAAIKNVGIGASMGLVALAILFLMMRFKGGK